jgi:hypothetical protein
MRRIVAGALPVIFIISLIVSMVGLQGSAWAWSELSTDRGTYSQGEQIRVHFAGAPGNYEDWICIVPSGAPDNEAGDWQHMPIGVPEGELVFTAPGPGRYEVRAYYNYRRSGYFVTARQSFNVENQGSSDSARYQNRPAERESWLLATDKHAYFQGEPVQVRFSGAPGYSSDWICIVPSGAPDNAPGTFQYMPEGVSQGVLTFYAPSPGRYEVRAYFNYRRDGYLVTARQAFDVSDTRFSGERGYRDDSPGVPPSEYGSMPPDPKLRQVQYILIERGYDPGSVDGVYGGKTRTAIRDFQRDNHLRLTGMLDKDTLKALGVLH